MHAMHVFVPAFHGQQVVTCQPRVNRTATYRMPWLILSLYGRIHRCLQAVCRCQRLSELLRLLGEIMDISRKVYLFMSTHAHISQTSLLSEALACKCMCVHTIYANERGCFVVRSRRPYGDNL